MLLGFFGAFCKQTREEQTSSMLWVLSFVKEVGRTRGAGMSRSRSHTTYVYILLVFCVQPHVHVKAPRTPGNLLLPDKSAQQSKMGRHQRGFAFWNFLAPMRPMPAHTLEEIRRLFVLDLAVQRMRSCQ